MENLRIVNNFDIYKEKSYQELLEGICDQMEELRRNQIYTISEQEKILLRTMSIEQATRALLDNQIDMRKNIDLLVGRWG